MIMFASGSFRGILTGYRNTDGTFNNGGTNTNFWSSVASGGSAWKRNLNSGNTGVNRNTNTKTYGFSVRCLKDWIVKYLKIFAWGISLSKTLFLGIMPFFCSTLPPMVFFIRIFLTV
jgi:hypothetical protein